MKTCLIVLVGLFVAGCSRNHYTPSSNVPRDADSLQLDNSFKMYIRTVYKAGSETEGAKLVINEDQSSKDLIEIDYLLFSKDHGQLIYIPTIPDPVQLYYRDHPPRRDTLNIEEFSRFQFGRVDNAQPDHIEFVDQNTRSKNVWVVRFIQDTFRIERIIQMESRKKKDVVFVYESEVSVNYALEQKISFIKQRSFHLVLDKRGQSGVLPALKNNRIYYTRSGTRYKIYFRLDKPIPGKGDKNVLIYKKRRIHFPPPYHLPIK